MWLLLLWEILLLSTPTDILQNALVIKMSKKISNGKMKSEEECLLQDGILNASTLSVFPLVLHIVLRLRSLMAEFLQCVRRGQGLLITAVSLSLSGLLHKLLNLHGQPTKLVLILLIQFVLKLQTDPLQSQCLHGIKATLQKMPMAFHSIYTWPNIYVIKHESKWSLPSWHPNHKLYSLVKVTVNVSSR